MSEADIPWGMQLKAANGWNQTVADWRRLISLEPGGCYVAELDGRPVGTLTTCCFGPVAWIAMVLVDQGVRRRGIARALMIHALAVLDAGGVPTIRLDATPLGQPLYEELGFVAEYTLDRFEGVLSPGAPVSEVGGFLSHYQDRILGWDRLATGTDRRKLLVRFFDEFPDEIRVFHASPDGGYLGSRPGSRARQIGPCIALSGAGRALFDDARSRLAGQPVFMDIPEANVDAGRWACDQGLTVQRRLLRMRRGPATRERPEMIWASSGPELG